MLLCKCATGLGGSRRRLQVVKWNQKKRPREALNIRRRTAEAAAAWQKRNSEFLSSCRRAWYVGEPFRIIASTRSYWKCMEILNRVQSQSRQERKWWKINCGFKKSISANHCNKSRFSFELQNSSSAIKKRQTSTVKLDLEVCESEFISVLMDPHLNWSIRNMHK